MIGGNNIMKLRKCSLFAAVVGALLLTAAFAPRANAVLAVYYNFEDQPPVPDFTSEAIGLQTPPLTSNFGGTFVDEAALGAPNNVFPTDPDQNLHSLGLKDSGGNNGAYFQFHANTNPLVGMSLSFAVNTMGNGYNSVEAFYSFDGFATPGTSFGTAGISSSTSQVISFGVPAAAEGQSDVTFRLVFSGATSSGNNLQNVIDNIRLDARAVIPEPSSVVGALLGACGLCWNQRRRLISLLRLRQA
jgi:hypothetical protein